MADANYVKFRHGTPAAFEAALKANKVYSDTLYFIYEENELTADLYLGSKLISSGEHDLNVVSNLRLGDLNDITINNAVIGDVLAYNENTQQWENYPIEALLEGYDLSLSVESDNLSIEKVDEKLRLKDFGVGYYAYVPAEKDNTGKIITPSSYEYVEGFKSGLEPRVVLNANNELALAWYEPGTETVEDISANIEDISKKVDNLDETINSENGLIDQVEKLSGDLGSKANADDVYTKEEIDETLKNVYTKKETDTAIGTAIADIDHLKRVIVQRKEDIEPNYFNKEDFNNYIFMVPTGLKDESDKYDEYIIIEVVDAENVSTKYIERVGSWEVNLNDYATKNDLKNKADELINLLGKSEKNIINSVDENIFKIVSNEQDGLDRQLQLKAVPVSKIQGLEDWITDNGATYIANIGTGNLSDELKKLLLTENSINLDHFQIIDGKLNLKETTNYVSIDSFNKIVGNLDDLLASDFNVYNEIQTIKDVLTWQNISMENV